MSVNRPLPDASAQQLAATAFAALETWRGLGRTQPPSPVEEAAVRPSFNRIYLFALGAADDAVAAAARADPATSRTLGALLARLAPYRMPRQAAAASGRPGGSSGGLPADALGERHGEGWRMRFAASRAEPGQVYVVIELDDHGATPRRLFAVTADDRCETCALPEARGGVIQLLEEERSPLLQALRQRTTEVSLL